MTRVVEAIYTKGRLEPVEALELPEQQRVELTLRVISNGDASGEGRSTTPWPEMEKTAKARLAALNRLFEQIDQADLQLKVRLPTRDELHDRS